MQAAAECKGEQVCERDVHCTDGRAGIASDAGRPIGNSDIPVRRYGRIPLLDDEPGWEIETGPVPRTIADFGGKAVLLAALGTAVLAGLLIYLR